MRQEAKTVTRKVKVLKNPNPTFVSLVEHGAIQEPFKVVKKADPNKGHSMAIRKREETSKSDGQTAVRKIVFDNAKFETVESVQKYLDANGWKDYTVTEKDSTFVASGKDVKDDDFDTKSIKTVKMVDDGSVLGYVGKLAEKANKKPDAEDEQDGGADEDTEGGKGKTKGKKQERTVKMSYWDMYSSDDQTVSGIIKDGMKDGVPPGCSEILQATAYAMANVIKAAPGDRSSLIKSIGGEFADLINATADLYDGVIDAKATKTDNTKKFAEDFRTELETIIKAKGKKPTGDDATGTGSQVNEKKDEKTETKKDETTSEKKDETVQAPAQNLEALAGLIGKSIADAVAPITGAINDLTKKVDTVQEVAEDARNKATKAAEEASAVASQAPTKKSNTEQGSHSASQEEARKASEAAEQARKENGLRNFGNALGLRR